MPAAAIKSFWMNGLFAPAVRKLLVAISNLRPIMAASEALRPQLSALGQIRDLIARTIARIRHDPPGD